MMWKVVLAESSLIYLLDLHNLDLLDLITFSIYRHSNSDLAVYLQSPRPSRCNHQDCLNAAPVTVLSELVC